MTALVCRTCHIEMTEDKEYCDNCFSILLDDLEIADAELKRLQRNFQRATGRRWVAGGGYRLKRRNV